MTTPSSVTIGGVATSKASAASTGSVSLSPLPDVTTLNQGWIVREDAALKAKLSGIRVPVYNDGDGSPTDKLQNVPVFFRLPEDEARRKVYPYITIDLLAPVRDVEREHRGVVTFGAVDGPNEQYQPGGRPAGASRVEMPIPYSLQYQVTTYARFARHDRVINVELLAMRLEPRFGYLEMSAGNAAGVPDDNTTRRMDLLSGPTNNDTRDGEGKRLFRKSYTVAVASEMFHSDFVALTKARVVVLNPARVSGFHSV